MSKIIKSLVGPISGFALFGTDGLKQGAINAIVAFRGGPLATALQIGLSLLPSGMKQRHAVATSVQIGEVPRAGIFGEACVGGSLVDAFNYGGKYKTDWTILILDLADHRCEALTGFFVNDDYVAFTGDGIVPGYRDQLAVYWRPGTWDQEVPAVVLANCPPFPAGHPQAGQPTWTADDRGRGVSYVVVAYKADKTDAKKPVWTGRIPSFRWVVKGLRCYSAREDDTVGGAGDHRWDDPDTREWSENPIDARNTWVRGIYAGDRIDEPAMLMLGRGLSAVEAPPANVFAPANLCDEDVDLPGGGSEKRYRIGGSWTAEDPFITVEEMIAAAVGGVILEREGSVEIEPGQAKAPVWFITDDDLIVGSEISVRDFLPRTDDAWVNTVAPRYIEPSLAWKDHGAPVRRDEGDIIADAGQRVATPSLLMVTSGYQAQRVGEQQRRLGRAWKRRELTLGPRFAGVEHGDWLSWTSARYGGTALFRVLADTLDQRWWNALSLREMRSDFATFDVDDYSIDGSVAAQPDAPPDIGEPGAGAWSLSVEVSAAGALLVFAGAVDDDRAELVIFEYAASPTAPDADDDGEWTSATTAAPSATRAEVGGIADGLTYWGAVSYRVDGERGDRLILGPVDYDASTFAPAPAIILSITPAAGSALLKWRNPVSANFGYSKLFRGTTAVFGAAVQIGGSIIGGLGQVQDFTDTVAAGTYYWWVQSFSIDNVAAAATGPVSATVT